jgi:hypothetical protein
MKLLDVSAVLLSVVAALVVTLVLVKKPNEPCASALAPATAPMSATTFA